MPKEEATKKLFRAVRGRSSEPIDLDMFRDAIEEGADLNATRGKENYTIVHHLAEAAISGKPGMHEALIFASSAGANLNAKDARGNTGLHLVAKGGEVPGAHAFLVAGANPRSRNSEGRSVVGSFCHSMKEQGMSMHEIRKHPMYLTLRMSMPKRMRGPVKVRHRK
jgi:hypothetical protein